MSEYSWDEIMIEKTDAELKIIFNNRRNEPSEKVEVAIAELFKRDILNEVSKKTILNDFDIKEIETSEISNQKTYKVKKKPIIEFNYKERLHEIANNSSKANTAVILVLVILFLDIISAYFSYLQLDLLLGARNGNTISNAIADANDKRQLYFAIFYFFAFIFSGITFIIWFHAAYSNLQIRKKICEFSKSQAIWSWIIPIISLFRPYHIMKEMYNDTYEKLEKIYNQVSQNKYYMLGIWWALWIVSNIANNIGQRVFKEFNTIESLISSTYFDIFISILGIPLAIVTVKVIQNYSKMESELYSLERNNEISFNSKK